MLAVRYWIAVTCILIVVRFVLFLEPGGWARLGSTIKQGEADLQAGGETLELRLFSRTLLGVDSISRTCVCNVHEQNNTEVLVQKIFGEERYMYCSRRLTITRFEISFRQMIEAKTKKEKEKSAYRKGFSLSN